VVTIGYVLAALVAFQLDVAHADVDGVDDAAPRETIAPHAIAPPLVDAAPDAPSAFADEGFRCPGDDPFFFEEMRSAGWVGYGETWDLTICDQGVPVYAEGATTAWPDFRLRRPARPPIDEKDILFYATILPYALFGGLAFVFGAAWLIALVQGRKRTPFAMVACGACGVRVPITAREVGVFCPSCGTGVVRTAADGLEDK
jgi:hypothetical protein